MPRYINTTNKYYDEDVCHGLAGNRALQLGAWSFHHQITEIKIDYSGNASELLVIPQLCFFLSLKLIVLFLTYVFVVKIFINI